MNIQPLRMLAVSAVMAIGCYAIACAAFAIVGFAS